MRRLGTESAFEVLAKAKALEKTGRKIIHLEIGEPDFDTPAHIVAAAQEAVSKGHTHYVPAPGIPELRESIAGFLGRTGRMTTSPGQVVITPGAKPIMFFTILALCEEGDEVIYPDPGFPMYGSIARFAGATAVPIPLREANGFTVDPDELASLVTDRTKLLILNSPHNPCGSALTKDQVQAIAELAIERDLTVLSDEVYWALRYDGVHESVLDVPGMAERTILLDGWSKTFAMTGWRLGFGVFPEALVEPISRLVINSVSCTSAFSQHAAIAALEGPWDEVERMRATFAERSEVITDGLNAVPGVSALRPGGAFYSFANITELGLPAQKVSDLLLERAGVAALPGTAFGEYGEGYLRFSYANSTENIRAALSAFETLVSEVSRG
ncbi:pyridoxal phosphate-dependent aminotransferase [Amycolatopsis anabasis]|uniref:pyridoxal phosphate-dependent aminotransferase n=1 Tax=Amycolatopsis anabasis TaxID=1840409 RepID=UPI00131C2EB7|nr:pyridoxal phosphate-dependent aminotransferase [Amycolatopsis anabasis]